MKRLTNEEIELVKQAMTSDSGNKSKTHIELGGQKFIIRYYGTLRNLSAWTGSTQRKVLSWDIPKTCENILEYFDKVSTEIEIVLNGQIRCSCCGEKFSIQEIEGGYNRQCFAGVYCQTCWDREWKEREANMNYD